MCDGGLGMGCASVSPCLRVCLSALPVCLYASLYVYQVWIDEKPLGGVEVISLPALPLPPDHAESGGSQILSEVRELYVCKVRSGSQMQWKSLRVSLVMGGGGGDGEDEANDGSEVSKELSHDAVWFAEMDRLFELGGLCCLFCLFCLLCLFCLFFSSVPLPFPPTF